MGLNDIFEKRESLPAPQPYYSPFHLLELAGLASGSYSLEKIEIAKTKLFEIQNEGSVVCKGLSISLQQAYGVLDGLNHENWSHHAIIFSNKGLLDFLEKNLFDSRALDNSYQFRYKPSFVQFISPYFTFSFLEISGKFIQKKDDFVSLDQLLNYSGFIAQADKEIAFSAIRDFISELTRKISSASWESFSADESLLYFIFSPAWKNISHKLPNEFLPAIDSLNEAAFQLLNRFERKASVQYLHEAAIQLGILARNENLQSRIRDFEIKIRKTKSPGSLPSANQQWESRAIWMVVGFSVICLVFILAYLVRSKVKPEEAEAGSYVMSQPFPDEMEESPANEELNSSVNEKNFKTFISLIDKRKVEGKSRGIRTGQPPFNNVSKPLGQSGTSTFQLRNRSGFDAILFYFTSENPLIDSSSRFYAVFIKSGENLEFLFDHNFGRFNLAFGEEWIHYQSAIDFPLLKIPGIGSLNESENQTVFSGTWKLFDFFKKPIAYQYFMNHDLLIQDFRAPNQMISGAPAARLIHEPAYNERNNRFPKKITLTLKREGNRIKVEAQGSLYVYESAETFKPHYKGKTANR